METPRCSHTTKTGNPCKRRATNEYGPFNAPIRVCDTHARDTPYYDRRDVRVLDPLDFPEIHALIHECDFWISAFFAAEVYITAIQKNVCDEYGIAFKRAVSARREYLRKLLLLKRARLTVERAEAAADKADGEYEFYLAQLEIGDDGTLLEA